MEKSENEGFNYFEVTNKIKFLTGYAIEVGSFTEKEKASELINKLESQKFNNIFIEEIISTSLPKHNIYIGNFKTLHETKDDIVKLLNMDSGLKVRIVNIGS